MTADVTDEPALRTALDEIIDRFGVPELLVYNTALFVDERGNASSSGALGSMPTMQWIPSVRR